MMDYLNFFDESVVFTDPSKVPTTEEIIEAAKMVASFPKFDRTPIKVTFLQYTLLRMISKEEDHLPSIFCSKLEILNEPKWHKRIEEDSLGVN